MRRLTILAVLLAGCSSPNTDHEKRLAALEERLDTHERRIEKMSEAFLKQSNDLSKLHQMTSAVQDKNIELLTRMQQFLGR